MSKNILEFCLSPDLGGLELFMVNCYKYFKTKGSCKIIVQEGKKLDKYLENDDNKFYIKRNKFFPIFPAKKLANYIDDNDIDILHFHWSKDIILVVLAKLLSKRKPKVIQTRNMSMTRFKDDFYHKWLYKNIDAMHAVTHQVKEELEKFIPIDVRPNIHMVYMGTESNKTDTNKISSLKEQYNLTDKDTFIVGIVGRIEEAKGQYLVIEAIANLKELNIKAIIVGSAMNESYLEKLKQKIRELKIEDKVLFTGFTKDVNEHMQLFDVNVLATTKETFGLVVIEAMINKIPMLATNRGGPLEILEDGKDGLLFDRTSEDLASKIETLYNNRELKESIAIAGFNKATEKFDKQIQLMKMYELMEKI